MATSISALVLRNYPDDDALQHPEKYSKALSFSPDIIPAYGTNPDKDTLVDPASWRGFTGFPIIGGEVNNVYIRGHGSGGPHVASLKVVPSELILWPHVWQNVNPVTSGPVVIPGGITKGPYVSDGPLQFRVPHTTGNTYSLVANVYKHSDDEEPQSFDLENFGVDDFVSFLAKDKTFTFYNVIVADPTLRQVSTTTRLRTISNSPLLLTFRINWHKRSPVPRGVEVSLVDDRGNITVPRVPLQFFGERTFLLEPSYDGVLMLNIFAPANNPHFEPYSGLSLQVFKTGVAFPPLLGALNIIFEPHSTRNIRFGSPAAIQLREWQKKSGNTDPESPTNGDNTPIPVTNPATGWWTRAKITDTNKFPHTPIGYCPDIQPIGTDLGKQNFVTILQDPSVDYSSANNVELVGDADNFIFMRGHSTLADIDVQARMYAVISSAANYPSHYLTQGIPAKVVGADGTTNELSISVAKPNQFYLFEQPFEISSPPGNSSIHYCLIGEVRQKRKSCPVYPSWPSDQWANYATLADFWAWVSTDPLMSWRNISWEPSQPGGQKSWTWSCMTQLRIPDVSSYCSFFTIIVECDNATIPAGSSWNLVCDDNKIFPTGTCFGTRPIGSKNAAIAGCHFTGATPGYNANLTLTVIWSDGGDSKIPPPSIQWRFAMTETLLSPVRHLAVEDAPGSEAWPFYVTQDYPYIGDDPNPSPLPSFKAAGVNEWPYKGCPQFNLGHVLVSAKRT